MTEMTAVSVDVVILKRAVGDYVQFRVHRRDTEPFADHWALPGVLLGSGERLTEAAVRAAGKTGIYPKHALACGQLAVFDEPNRDPRGPTLSVTMWMVVGDDCAPAPDRNWGEPSRFPRRERTGLWAIDPQADSPTRPRELLPTFDEIGDLAFDHSRILADVRPILSQMLWTNLDFTRALTGPVFPAFRARLLTESLTGKPVDRGNLNRTLKRIAIRGDGTLPPEKMVGRPSYTWRWSER